MTVAIVLSDCPPKLRGDMTKWFIEISTGIYVGNMNARIRDELWDRITENIGHGHATMIFTTAGEQHMDFRVHNAYWEPIDYDGIKLMRRPERIQSSTKKVLSSAAKRRIGIKRGTAEHAATFCVPDYAVLDLETTGLDEKKDSIIEIGVIIVIQNTIVDKKQVLIQLDNHLPEEIVSLTGLTDSDLRNSGVPLCEALTELLEIVEDLPIVSHNAVFEQKFLREAYQSMGEHEMENRFIDTLKLSKLLLPDMADHKLSTIAGYLEIEHSIKHRALADCEVTYSVYCKLNELISSSVQNNEN